MCKCNSGVDSQVLENAECGNCRCEQCSGPAPFFNQAPACQESHTKVLQQQLYHTAVSIDKPFNMPACGSSVSISLAGVLSLIPGSYLWNPNFGYLLVTAFDPVTGFVSVMNDCNESNVVPGTKVPSCTLFNVVDPPYSHSEECGDGVYVTSDFVAPAVGGSVSIDITTTEGLLLNAKVQVGVGVYLLTAILTPQYITIKNDGGAGIVPGTTIHAKDSQNRCITPITPYKEDLCSVSDASPGALVICDGNGHTATLTAPALGAVPVCTNVAENQFTAKVVDLPSAHCTSLTACLSLVAGTSSYHLAVANSAGFEVDNLVTIQYAADEAVPAHRWVVTCVPDGTHLDIESVGTQSLNVPAIDIGTQLCLAPCCEQVAYLLGNPCKLDFSSAQKSAYVLAESADDSGSVSPGDPAFVSTTQQVVLTNTTCNDMVALVVMDFLIQGTVNVSDGAWSRWIFEPKCGAVNQATTDPAPTITQAVIRSLRESRKHGQGPGSACATWDEGFFMQFHYTKNVVIPAGHTYYLDASLQFTNNAYKDGTAACSPVASGDATGECTITIASTHIHVLGTAVQS